MGLLLHGPSPVALGLSRPHPLLQLLRRKTFVNKSARRVKMQWRGGMMPGDGEPSLICEMPECRNRPDIESLLLSTVPHVASDQTRRCRV